MKPNAVTIARLDVMMEKDDEPVAFGAGAMRGHAAANAMLALHLGARGGAIPAGTLPSSGGFA